MAVLTRTDARSFFCKQKTNPVIEILEQTADRNESDRNKEFLTRGYKKERMDVDET